MKVLLIDDHALFRDGFKLLLARMWGDQLEIIEADNAEAGLELDVDQQFDFAFLDLGLPGLNGIDGLRAYRRRFPTTCIVVMSGIHGEEIVRQALVAGAQGYIPKSISGEAMLEALQHIEKGEVYVPEIPIDELHKHHLTPRELEVLGEMCAGRTNEEISEQLGMSANTVRVHIKRIFESFHVRSRTEAVLTAKRKGIF